MNGGRHTPLTREQMMQMTQQNAQFQGMASETMGMMMPMANL